MTIDIYKVMEMRDELRDSVCMAHLAAAFGETRFTSCDFTDAMDAAAAKIGGRDIGGANEVEMVRDVLTANIVPFRAMSRTAKITLVLTVKDILSGIFDFKVEELFRAVDGNGIFDVFHKEQLVEFAWPEKAAKSPEEQQSEAESQDEDEAPPSDPLDPPPIGREGSGL